MALIIPKNNADAQTLDATLQIYYEANDWVENSVLIDKLSSSLDNMGIEDEKKEPQSYTKKTQVLAYFGFITWQDVTNNQSPRMITDLGRKFFEARKNKDEDLVLSILIESLSKCTFGRNVIGCDSDSDIEAPNVFIKATLLLGGISNNEFAYILGRMEFHGEEFHDALLTIKVNRLKETKTYPEENAKKWSDPKPITALKNWGFFNSEDNTISDKVFLKYANQLLLLRTKNTESVKFRSNIEPDNIEDNFSSTNTPYINAIKTKPFLILGGFSGTGKSQKVKELAFMTCPNDNEMSAKLGNTENSPGNYCLVSVRPNWHDSSDLLGFYSTINDKYMVTDFVRFMVKARHYSEIPFFVCLDEMNLAPVEEYFAEFLSVIESRKKIGNKIVSDPLISKDWFNKSFSGYNIFEDLGLEINGDEYERKDIVEELKEKGLCIPQNLIVIGTVNMDDTTNSFSRKVIDRAMTFETVVDDFTNSYYESDDTLRYGNATNGNFAWMLPDEVNAKEMLLRDTTLLSDNQKNEILNFINDINKQLESSPFQISYRILNETILYYRAKNIIEKKVPDMNDVFDDILMQKILPRIEGDYDKTHKPLANLEKLAIERNWPNSIKKIQFMKDRLNNDDHSGFTSFWN